MRVCKRICITWHTLCTVGDSTDSIYRPQIGSFNREVWFIDCIILVCFTLQSSQAFNMIDQNRDGFIDHEDLKDMLASLGELTDSS